MIIWQWPERIYSKLSIFIWNLALLYGNDHTRYKKLSMFIWILAWLYDNDQREYIESWAYLFGIWHCYMAMTIHDIRSWACLFGFWHGYMTMTITNIKYVTFSRSLARIRKVRNNVQYGAPYSLAHWNFIRHFEKHEAWRTVNRKTVAFWGTTRSPAFLMHKFMSENLRVNIWRNNSNYRIQGHFLSLLSEAARRLASRTECLKNEEDI